MNGREGVGWQGELKIRVDIKCTIRLRVVYGYGEVSYRQLSSGTFHDAIFFPVHPYNRGRGQHTP